MKQDGHYTYVPGIHSHGFFISVLQGSWREAIYVQLVCHSVEDRSRARYLSQVLLCRQSARILFSEGCEVFCRMLQVLKVAFGRSKLAESGRNREQSISDGANFARIESTASLNFYLQGSDARICQGYSAGVLAADFIWSTGYAVPSTVLDSTLSHIFAM